MGEALKGWLRSEKPSEKHEENEKPRGVKNMIGFFENQNEVLQVLHMKTKSTVDLITGDVIQAVLVEQDVVLGEDGVEQLDTDFGLRPGVGEN